MPGRRVIPAGRVFDYATMDPRHGHAMNTIERLVQFIECQGSWYVCATILWQTQMLLLTANAAFGWALPGYILLAPLWMPAAWWASGGLTYTLCYLVFE